jgi:uncharacterized protein YjeT (DUF2065 family)
MPAGFFGDGYMWHDLLIALSLVMVIEGIVPFLSPGSMRKMVRMVGEMDDRSLRIAGLVSMLLGILMLYVVN